PIRFAPARDYPAATVSSGLGAGAVAAADFDLDGARDLVVSNCGGGGPSVLPGDGHGGFGPPRAVPTDADACAVASGDLHGDGRPDIAVTDVLPDKTVALLPGELEVLLGKGDGTFAARTTYPVGGSPEYVDTADLDHDGRLDLVVGNAIFNN